MSAPAAHLWSGSAGKLAILLRVTWLPNVFISPEESVELQRTKTQEQIFFFSFQGAPSSPGAPSPTPSSWEGRAAVGRGEIAMVGMQVGDDGGRHSQPVSPAGSAVLRWFSMFTCPSSAESKNKTCPSWGRGGDSEYKDNTPRHHSRVNRHRPTQLPTLPLLESRGTAPVIRV